MSATEKPGVETVLPEEMTANQLASRCNDLFQGQQLNTVGEAILNLLCNYVIYSVPSPEEEINFYEKLPDVIREGVANIRSRRAAPNTTVQ